MTLGSLHASNKRVQGVMNPPGFETYGQGHPNSHTEGTSGPTKWTSVQQKLLKSFKKVSANTDTAMIVVISVRFLSIYSLSSA